MSFKIKCWIEAMRLRTLPVSIAGVLMGVGFAGWYGSFQWSASLLCLMFALLMQIASNFANEYYDFKNGLDRKGREGFRRGVTEGDITPSAMRIVLFSTIILTSVVGLSLIYFGGWWLIAVGVAIVIFALAYSTGPYPLSHHGLGDLAVILFFGFVPVMFTAYLQIGDDVWMSDALPASFCVGLMAANVLIVNNYRDMDDDMAVNKKTTVVIFGRKVMRYVYLFSGIVAVCLMIPFWIRLPLWTLCVPLLYLVVHVRLSVALSRRNGHLLNPLLGATAVNLMVYSVLTMIVMFVFG